MTDTRSAAPLSEAYRDGPGESGDSFRTARAARAARAATEAKEVQASDFADWAEPGDTTSRRGRWLTWVIAALVLAAGIGIAVLIANTKSDDSADGSQAPDRLGTPTKDKGTGTDTGTPVKSGPAASTPASTPASTVGSTPTSEPTSPGAAGGTAGPVKVVEQGWSMGADQKSGSFAVVLQNSGAKPVGAFEVRVKGWDGAGRPIAAMDDWARVVGTLAPGQRLGIADRLATGGMTSGISRLQVTVVELAPDAGAGAGPTRLPAGAVRVHGVSRKVDAKATTVTYDAESTYAVALDADAYLLLRDAKGSLLGGVGSTLHLPARGAARGDFTIRNATVAGDIATAEVYVVPRPRS